MAIHFSVIFLVTCWLGQLRMSDASTSENCGAPEDPLHFSPIVVTPHPVIVPGNVSAKWTAELSRSIPRVMAKLQFSKFNGKTWDKIDCPPIHKCNVTFCRLLGRPDTCTLEKGTLVPAPKIYVYTIPIPSGKYHSQFIFTSDGNRVGCLDLKYEVISI